MLSPATRAVKFIITSYRKENCQQAETTCM